jgi:hypothetical protein
MASPSETARAAILGVPFDPNKKPDRIMTVKAIEQMDAKVIGVTAGAIIRDTLAGLNAVTNPPARQMAWVLGDATIGNNGVYENTGTSGAPVWTRRGDLPYGVNKAINVGAGTANAIVATTSIPTSESQLIILPIVAENTASPVTVAFNGGSALTIKTLAGNDVAVGGLVPGNYLGTISGSTFRLLSDQASAALLTAMEALKDETQQLRDEALSAVPNTFAPTRAALKALDTTTKTSAYLTEAGREGQFIWRSGDYNAEVAADTQEGIYIEADAIAATSGAWVRVVVNEYSIKWFGAGTGDATGVADTAAFLAAASFFGTMSASAFGNSNGGVLRIPRGVYYLNTEINFSEAGVRVVGDGIEATKIYCVAGLGADKALLKFDQSNDLYSNVGCTCENLYIHMQGFTGHGIWWLKPYDGFNPTNISVYGVHDDYNAYRIERDPDNTADAISQTATLTNLIGAHAVSTTATASIFYCEDLQEAVFVNCKGFGSQQPVDATETKADCHTFEFVDCRGITMIGCSSAFSKKHGIRIRTATRPSAGIFIYGHTYETIDGCLRADGNAVVGVVSQVDHGTYRSEGAVSHADGTFDLNMVYSSSFNVGSRSINIDADCQQILVMSRDRTAITNNGTRTTIVGQDSDASPGVELRGSRALLSGGAGGQIDVQTGMMNFKADGETVGRMQYPWTASQAGLLVAVNRSGTVALSQVEIGAADSGGSGWRILRVAN